MPMSGHNFSPSKPHLTPKSGPPVDTRLLNSETCSQRRGIVATRQRTHSSGRGDAMEATDLPPDGREPNTTPPWSPAITRTRGRWVPWFTLALAVLWLIASAIAGIGLIRDDPEAAS